MAKTGSPTAYRPGAARYLDLSPDKLRGGYYTPTDLAEWTGSNFQGPTTTVRSP
jgi:hypothetical protein